MSGDRNDAVEKTVKDLQESKQSKDMTALFDDIRAQQADPAQMRQYLEQVNKTAQERGVLTNLEIVGLEQNKLVLKDSRSGNTIYLDEHTQVVRTGKATETINERQAANLQNDRQPTNQGDSQPANQGDRQAANQGDRRTDRPVERTQSAQERVDSRAPQVEGSRIQRDEKGQVSKVEYANGKSQEFTRDEKGDITRVRNEDGQTWNKGKDGVWTMDGSNPPVKWEGKLRTDSAGNFIKQDKDGTFVERNDGSQISFDAKQRLTSVQDCNGVVRTFEYGADNKVTKISDSDGSSISTKDGGKTWTRVEGGKEAKVANVEVDKDGNVSYEHPEKKGHKVTERANGSVVEANEKGLVTHIKNAKGQEFDFQYGPDGKLTQVKNLDGTWTSKDGHTFVNQDMHKGVEWKGNVQVHPDGNYEFTSDSGRHVAHRPDGTKLVDYPQVRRTDQTQEAPGDGRRPPSEAPQQPRDGSQVVQNSDGSITRVYQDGTRETHGQFEGGEPYIRTQYRDGSETVMNERGQVTHTRDARGRVMQYHYDSQGQMDWIKTGPRPEDMIMRTGPDTWRAANGESYRGRYAVDQHGHCHYQPNPEFRGRQGGPQEPTVLTRNGQMMREKPGTWPQPGAPPQRPEVPGRPSGDAPPAPRPNDQPPPTSRPTDQPPAPRPNDQPPSSDKPPTPQPSDTRPPTSDKPPEEPPKPPERKPKPTKLDNFKPKNGVYSPVGPPGLGESGRGEKYDSEKEAGEGNIDIDFRKADTKENADGSTTYTYNGELEDSGSWYTPWEWGDTNFSGSETWSKDGELLERKVEYDGGKDLTFAGPNGNQEIKDVTKVSTTLNTTSEQYETIITTSDGTTYKAVTTVEGKVMRLDKETTAKK